MDRLFHPRAAVSSSRYCCVVSKSHCSLVKHVIVSVFISLLNNIYSIMPEAVQMDGACGFCPPCTKDMLMCEHGFSIAFFQAISDAK